MTDTNKIIHLLYNDFANRKDPKLQPIEDTLLKVYKKIDSLTSPNSKQIPPLVSRLVRYIYFYAFSEHIHLSPEEENLLVQLCDIGKLSGLNGLIKYPLNGLF